MRFDISTHFKITLEYREKLRRNYTDKCYRPNMCAGEGAWRWRLVIYPDNCTYLSVIGRISVQREGAWRRLAMYPDNFTYLSVIGRISVRGEGAWRRLAMHPDHFTYLSVIGRISVRGQGAWRRLQTRTRVQVHQWDTNDFLVRMVVPGTKPVENPCCI